MSTKGGQIRQSEYPIIGGFIFSSFKEDFDEFNMRYTLYTEEYLNEFEAQLNIVKSLETSESIRRELKEYTTGILYVKADEVSGLLKLLRGYFRHAKLNYSLVSQTRRELESRDIESAINGLQTIKDYLLENEQILKDKGLKQEIFDQLYSSRDELYDMKIIQNNKKDKRQQSTKDNKKEYNKLYEILTDVATDGKEIFEGNKSKVKQYTFSYLIERMRKEKKRVD